MLLSGNAKVAFPSRTATIAAAATLPRPAAVGAPVNAVTGATTAAVTGLPALPAANVAAPSSNQKRKTCLPSQPGIG
jgi:hypothetical protein